MCYIVTPTKPSINAKGKYVVQPTFSATGGNATMPPPSSGKGRKLDRFDPAERSKRVGKTKEELLADL